MKISLEDKDIDAIAKAVAKAMGGKPAKAAAKAEADDDSGDGGEGDGGEGDGGGDGDFEGGEGGGEETTVDADDVKAALTALSKKHGQDKAMEVLKKAGGVGALSKLSEKKFQAVIDAANKATKAAK